MRRRSAKREKLTLEVEEWRDEFRWRVNRCEMCLQPAGPEHIDVHECVPGSHRAKALTKPFAILALTRLCHNAMEKLTIPHQLAYLLRARPDDYDLPAYWELTGRQWPDHEEVLRWKDSLPNSKSRS